MAEEFLSQLLRVENSVQPNSGECCIVCLTEYGTLCPKTGIVELEIRLPCNHTVGSKCIATWLDLTGVAKNSCPLCRYAFFPTQPRPYLEHGVIEDVQNAGSNDPGASYGLAMMDLGSMDENRLPVNTHFVYEHLNEGRNDNEGIAPEPPVMAEQVHTLRRSARLRGIAPEPLEQENTPRRSARQRATAHNHERQMHREDIDEAELDLQTIRLMCETYCYRLNLNLFRGSSTIEISQRIAVRTRVACQFAGHSMQPCAAVSVYVTSHLTGAPKTLHEVSMMSGVDSGVILGIYNLVYSGRVRAEFLDHEMLAMINRGDRETVLEFMPLSSQSL